MSRTLSFCDHLMGVRFSERTRLWLYYTLSLSPQPYNVFRAKQTHAAIELALRCDAANGSSETGQGAVDRDDDLNHPVCHGDWRPYRWQRANANGRPNRF